MANLARFLRAVDEFLRTQVPSIESDFGLPVGFIGRLANEDDWSFVIKGNALIEAAITQLVAAQLGHPALTTTLQATSLLGRAGKLRMAESLSLIEKPFTTFVSRFAELRNTLVHDVKHVAFDFPTYIRTLNDDERRSFETALIVARPNPGGLLPASAFEHYKTFVWFNLCAIMVILNSRRSVAEKNRMISELEAELGRPLRKPPAT